MPCWSQHTVVSIAEVQVQYSAVWAGQHRSIEAEKSPVG